MSFNEWLEGFPRGRKKQMLNACVALSVVPYGGMVESYRKAFVKRDFSIFMREDLLTNHFDGVSKDPRMILAPSERMLVTNGPWFKSFSHYLASVWGRQADNSWPRIVYAAGMTAEDGGQWLRSKRDELGDCCFVMGDLSRYDAHEGDEAHAFKRFVYCGHGLRGKALRAFNDQSEFRAFGVCGHTVGGLTQVGSGQNDTSCGNSVTNGVMLDKSLQDFGVPESCYAILLMGDDFIALVSRKFATTALETHLNDAYLVWGFVLKTRITNKLSDVVFCSRLFWPVDGDDFILGPRIGRSIAKFSKTFKKPRDKLAHLKGVAKGLYYSGSFLPVLGQMLARTLFLCSAVDKEDVKQYYAATKEHTADSRTRAFFSERYGIGWDEANKSADIEISSVCSLPCAVNFGCHYAVDLENL